MPLSLKMSGKGLLQIRDYLTAMAERSVNMTPAWDKIAMMIETMMAAVWAGGGLAPEFGMMSAWAPLQGNAGPLTTVQRRTYYPTPHLATPNLAFGFLRDAAISPLVATTADNVILNINPAKRGAPADYARGNYAKFAQTGTPNAPARPFFQVTPIFLELVKGIMATYIVDDVIVGNGSAPKTESASYSDRGSSRKINIRSAKSNYAKRPEWANQTTASSYIYNSNGRS